MRTAREVKAASEAALRALGGSSPSSLPEIGMDDLEFGSSEQVARRALVLHVHTAVSFGTSQQKMRRCLTTHGLLDARRR